MPSVFDWLKARKRALTPKKRGAKFPPSAKIVIIITFILLIGMFFWFSGQIIHPFIWAVITTYLFAPLIYFLESRTKVPRGIWIILLYVMLGLVIYWLLSYAIPIANYEISEMVGMDQVSKQSFLGRIEEMGNASVLGIQIDYKELITKLRSWLRHEITNLAVPVLFGFAERLVLISAYFIITFYLLLDGEKYIRLFLLMFPSRYRKELTDVAADVNVTIGAYIRGQVILILIMSIASWIVLSLLRVHYAFVLCLATGVLEVVPIIGPIVATALASLVAFYQPTVAWGLTNTTLTLIVISVYFILRQIEDLIVIPNVVGKFIHVHPVLVLFAIFIGAKIGGVLGIFLALPASAVLKVLINYFYPKLVG